MGPVRSLCIGPSDLHMEATMRCPNCGAPMVYEKGVWVCTLGCVSRSSRVEGDSPMVLLEVARLKPHTLGPTSL